MDSNRLRLWKTIIVDYKQYEQTQDTVKSKLVRAT